MARFSAASAFSSSSYIRKRLPHPKARMETLAPVRPSVRWGRPREALSAATLFRMGSVAAAELRPSRSRKPRRERFLLMDDSSQIAVGLASSPAASIHRLHGFRRFKQQEFKERESSIPEALFMACCCLPPPSYRLLHQSVKSV